MSFIPRTCVRMHVHARSCVRRDRVSHAARSRDRTEPGHYYFAAASNQIPPCPVESIEQIYRYSPRAFTLAPKRFSRPAFRCGYFGTLRVGGCALGRFTTWRKKRTFLEVSPPYGRKCILFRPVILMSQLFRLTRPDISRATLPRKKRKKKKVRECHLCKVAVLSSTARWIILRLAHMRAYKSGELHDSRGGNVHFRLPGEREAR